MILRDFKNLVRSMSVNMATGKLEDDVFNMRVFTALKRVATDTVPSRLVEIDNTTIKVFRKIDNNTFIRFPRKPIDDQSIVDMDDSLLDAVGYLCVAKLDRSNSKTNMGLYYKEIENSNKRLFENDFYEEDITNPSDDVLP